MEAPARPRGLQAEVILLVFSWGNPPAWLEHWWTSPVSMETGKDGPPSCWPPCSHHREREAASGTGAEKMGRKQVPSLHQESGPSRR